MKFDWVTWSIWGVGLAILIIWIIQSAKEYRGILKRQNKELTQREEKGRAKNE
ncbi:MAG: hypothetical protein U9N06_00695 [candidate division WOR-3 bacterium]|nr:hypothetical protein [candidate division WOR-3 bacterium]